MCQSHASWLAIGWGMARWVWIRSENTVFCTVLSHGKPGGTYSVNTACPLQPFGLLQ